MKKLVSLILCLAMALAWLPAGSPLASAADSSPFAGGSGTAEDPYLVSTPEQLKAVADYPESCFLQIADINLNTGYSLSGAADLKGTYDGGGHRIIGYQGSIHNGYSIFRYNYGTIRNLGLFACRIAIETRFNDNVFPDKSMGLLTIYNYGTIENCYIEDTHTAITLNKNIKWETDTPEMDIGGFSAVNTGTIRNCYVTGYIRVYSNFYYVSPGRRIDMREGGITAINGETGRVENCFVSCDIFQAIPSDIEGTRWVGLFCGENNGAVTSCCFDSSGSTTNDHGTGTYDVQKKTGAEAAEYLNQQNGGIPYWGWGSSTDNDEPVLNYRELGASSSLPSGVYDLPVTDVALSLNLPNENAELYYEIKGSGEGKQPYTQPLTITGETELFVYGQHKDSDKIYQVTYYHYWDRPSPVTATPEERVQSQPVEVELSAASEGAKIWYTLDGTDPTEGESRFDYELNGPIRIRKRTTITAVAEVDGIYGPVERFEYVISPPITASPQAGVQTGPIEVELECELEDYDIYYTTDGLDPAQYGTEYTKPIPIFQTTDLKVVPKIDDQFGEVTTFHYEYSEAVITPSVLPGEYDGVQRLTLSCSPDYLDLYYTLDNGQQQHYQGETIHIYQTSTLTVYAKYQGQTVASQTFRYELPALEITADPVQGTYAEIKTITLTSNPDDYALFYTLDGSDPADNGIRYQQPFELDHSATVRVCAKYGIKVVAGGPFSFEYTMNLPYVIAKTEPGASRAPLLVKLEVSEGGYDIYYTLDGSDPKDSDIKYEGPFWINEPVTTVVRAVPKDKYFSDYGTTSQFCYTFPYQTFTVEKEKAEKHADYELTLTVSNTLPEKREVTFYAAAYLNGRMLGVAAKQAELPEGTENKSVTISYPYDGLLPDGAEFKVFCLDSKTRQPYCEPLTDAVSEAEVFQELASISVSPNPIVGQVGETVARPTVTAHYTNGKPDAVVTYNITIKPDYDVVIVSYPSQNLIIEREGTGSVTVSYSEGGITKSIEVPVTGVAPVANLGFLANPTADPLPEDAIPISNAQELAAIGGSDSVGKTYYLANDIQLTGEWSPIYGFQGTLDGRGHKVSGLYISADSEGAIRETGVSKETVDPCYVVDETGKLLGSVSIRDLILSPAEEKVAQLADTDAVTASPQADQEEVAQLVSKYDLLSLPVTDSGGRLLGIITVDDILDVLQQETTEDMEKMAGITPSEKPYMRTSVFSLWKSRVPWLLLLMVSATFTSMIISRYEDALAACVTLTAYIPMLMDTGGNCGSQSSTTVIRALSLGQVRYRDTLRVVWKEARVALLCGATLAAVNFVKLMLFDRVTAMVAATVCLTMVVTVFVAKLAGCLLPIGAKRVGVDPANMASPFITTIVDALSLLIYFDFARLLLLRA